MILKSRQFSIEWICTGNDSKQTVHRQRRNVRRSYLWCLMVWRKIIN